MSAEMSHEQCPRILVIHRIPFGEMIWGKSMTALFNGWPKECLAQLYHENIEPISYSTCENYFRLTGVDVVDANLKFSKAKGRIFCNSVSEQELDKSETHSTEKKVGKLGTYNTLTSNSAGTMAFARSLAWRKSKWTSQNLKDWLDDFRPQAVFFYCSRLPFVHKIANWICKQYDVPLFVYVMDDLTYDVSRDSSLFSRLFHRYYMKWFKKSVRHAKKVYTVSHEMMVEYKKKYSLDDVGILFNSVSVDGDITHDNFSRIPIRFIYAGNLYLDRWKVLCSLADSLAELNNQGYDMVLDIYSVTPPEDDMLNMLNRPPVSFYKGSLNQTELFEEISKSNVLVHVESFDEKNIDYARLSISTKISDYLVSNRVILAIGPKQVSSTKHLDRHNAALCIYSMNKDDIAANLKEKLFDENYRKQLLINARNVAIENHDMQKIQAGICEDFRAAVQSEQ